MLYQVYISGISYKTQPAKRAGVESVGYNRRVRADSREAAFQKCLPDIIAEFPKLRGKRVSVFVGRVSDVSEAASRMMPFSVEITNEGR